jgi:hypothetical protein
VVHYGSGAGGSVLVSLSESPLPSAYYRYAPVSMGNTFQDPPRLRETADNTELYI